MCAIILDSYSVFRELYETAENLTSADAPSAAGRYRFLSGGCRVNPAGTKKAPRMRAPGGLFLFAQKFDLAQAETSSEEPLPDTAGLFERVVAAKRSAMAVFTPLFRLIPDVPLVIAPLAGAVTCPVCTVPTPCYPKNFLLICRIGYGVKNLRKKIGAGCFF